MFFTYWIRLLTSKKKKKIATSKTEIIFLSEDFLYEPLGVVFIL